MCRQSSSWTRRPGQMPGYQRWKQCVLTTPLCEASPPYHAVPCSSCGGRFTPSARTSTARTAFLAHTGETGPSIRSPTVSHRGNLIFFPLEPRFDQSAHSFANASSLFIFSSGNALLSLRRSRKKRWLVDNVTQDDGRTLVANTVNAEKQVSQEEKKTCAV